MTVETVDGQHIEPVSEAETGDVIVEPVHDMPICTTCVSHPIGESPIGRSSSISTASNRFSVYD
jgi:hypothetical protein